MNSVEIYSKKTNGIFYSPFNFCIDKMEHLILINFEKDSDSYYNVFELQKAYDENNKSRLLLIGYQKDGSVDIYYQDYYPFGSQRNILNNVNLFIRTLENAKFEISSDNLEVFFALEDKYGRQIKVEVSETNISKKKPFFLLAPVGVTSNKPMSLPIYSLYKMSFLKRKFTHIDIEINNIKHKPDTFPLPINYSKNYFTRYSADTFNIDWNKNQDGPLFPLEYHNNNIIYDNKTSYEIENNSGHLEIKRMSISNIKHQININFSPPFPDIACIKLELDKIINGKILITTDNTKGLIKGDYSLHAKDNEIFLNFSPTYGWIPNEDRWILKILFFMVKIFKKWPSSYLWNANIKFDSNNNPIIHSSWSRK